MSIEDARELVESLVIAPECQIIKTIDLKGTLIMSLDELEQYRAIGTVSELRELKEKATAIKSDGFSDHLLNMGYTKGMKDGYAKAIEEFAEAIKYEFGSDDIHETVDKIASELKGE